MMTARAGNRSLSRASLSVAAFIAVATYSTGLTRTQHSVAPAVRTIRGAAADPVNPQLRAAIAALELDHPLVAVVVADIDSDGDSDLVASDDAADLIVLINDGGGRYTRRIPQRSRGWQTGPSGPSLSERPLSSLAFTPTSPPELAAAPGGGESAPATVLACAARRTPQSAEVCVLGSRAPPASILS